MRKVIKEIQDSNLNGWIEMLNKLSPGFDWYAGKFNKKTGKDLVRTLNTMSYSQREVVLQFICASYGLGHETSRSFFTRKKVV